MTHDDAVDFLAWLANNSRLVEKMPWWKVEYVHAVGDWKGTKMSEREHVSASRCKTITKSGKRCKLHGPNGRCIWHRLPDTEQRGVVEDRCRIKEHFTCDGLGTLCKSCGEAEGACVCDDGYSPDECPDCGGTGRICVKHEQPSYDGKTCQRELTK